MSRAPAPGSRTEARGASGDRIPPRLRVRTLLVGIAIRPLARSARRSGVDAASVDHFGDRDHRRALPVLSLLEEGHDEYSARSLLRLSERVEAGEVVYGADLENHPGLVDRLAAGRRLLGNPAAVLAAVRDPFAWTDALDAAGLPVPEVRRHDEPPSGGADEEWLRKPLRGGGGGGVGRWRAGDPVPEREYLQRRIPGPPLGAAFVSDGRSVRILAVSEMLVGREAFGADGYRYCGSLLALGAAFPPRPPLPGDGGALLEEIHAVAARLVGEFGLRGLNGIDGVLREGSFWPVEVNPRWTASMELLEPGPAPLDGPPAPPLFRVHREACLGNLSASDRLGAPALVRRWGTLPRGVPRAASGSEGGWVVGKAIVRASTAARAPDLEAVDGLLPADVPATGARIPAGGPVCTLLAAGRNREDCLARLEAGAERVRSTLEPIRR